MTESANTGWWWRFSRYEIRNGYIRPDVATRLESYDPWAAYWKAREQGGAPPYQSLLGLLEKLSMRPMGEGPYSLVPESESALLEWCANNGLLGVLPHRSLMVVLSPRMAAVKESGRRSQPVLTRYVRTATGWQTRVTYPPFDWESSHTAEHAKRRAGERRSKISAPADWPKPGVWLQDLVRGHLEEEPLIKTWSRFFPGVSDDHQETFQYPTPLSEGFWQLYAEPLDAFLGGALALKAAISAFTRRRVEAWADAGTRPERRESARQKLLDARSILHGLAGPVSPVLEVVAGGKFRQRWVATSLLASLALMALQDLAEQRRVLSCSTCGAIFVSDAHQATYCSAKCRHRAQKRAQRAKRRQDSNPGEDARRGAHS